MVHERNTRRRTRSKVERMSQAYPLAWPAGWKRTNNPERSNFHSKSGKYSKQPRSVAKARDEVLLQLERIVATSAVISTNIQTTLAGVPYSNRAEPEDRGAAVYFVTQGKEQCIPCDKWDRVADNLWAIAKTLDALRGIERWGAKEMVDAAFRGFEALPAPGQIHLGQRKPWHEVLQVSPDADKEIIQVAYRRLARKYHPDNQQTGDENKFHEIEKAKKEAGL